MGKRDQQERLPGKKWAAGRPGGSHEFGQDLVTRTRIAIVDDHPLFRAGVIQTFKGSAEFDVVAQGATAEDAVQLARRVKPEILLLGVDISGGLVKALEDVAEASPAIRVILLTFRQKRRENDGILAQALKFGVRGYLLKGADVGEFVRVLRSVKAGETYLPSGKTSPPANEASKGIGHPATWRFTAREGQILEGLATGMSNREIGEKLHLSEGTVSHHTTSLMRKMRVHSRVKAALIAQRSGFLSG